ncbi:MAG: hypothetical protein P4M07_06855 [Xanthobacteraceae bacterium]|nr:hypothetical protein [Xanthobacteraceae bacterium]
MTWIGKGLLAAATVVTGILLAGCAQQEERPQAAASTPAPDDDAYCQAKGFKLGSDQYVSCRKERDYAASLRAQQDKKNSSRLGDFMINNPATPR